MCVSTPAGTVVWRVDSGWYLLALQPKGADRKQKTDREKIEKQGLQEREKYQPSYESTVLTEVGPNHCDFRGNQTLCVGQYCREEVSKILGK